MPGIDSTDNVFRVRQKDYKLDDYKSIATITLTNGIQQVTGYKDNGEEVLSLIFAKNKYKKAEDVKQWIDKHDKYRYNAVNELTAAAFYDEFANTEFVEMYELPVELFEEINPDDWLFICREFDLDGRGTVTKADLEEMKTNYENNVRGIKLDIDYDHKKRRDDAAGWYGDMKIEKMSLQDGREVWALFTKPEWTAEARKALTEKSYRYFSPEIGFKYYDNEKKKWFKNVLFGGGLTNRPEIKGQPLIGMAAAEEDNKQTQEVKMKLSELFKKIGVSFSENDDDNVSALSTKFEDMTKAIEKKDSDIKELSENIEKLNGEKDEAEKAKTKLAEKVGKMEEDEKKRVEAEKVIKANELCKKAIKEEKVTPADANYQESKGWFFEMFKDSAAAGEKYLESMPKLTKKAAGSSADADLSDEDKRFEGIKALAEKKMEADKNLSFDEAFKSASTEYTEGGND